MILLCSGGLDSIATWRLLDCPKAVYFPLRTQPQARELAAIDWASSQEWATRAIWKGSAVNMSQHEGLNGYVPYRNVILVALAAQFDPHVVVPMIAEWAPDKNVRFFRWLAELLTRAGAGSFQGIDQECVVETPFAHHTKAQLLERYEKAFGRNETRALCDGTWSCYRDGTFHCGRCSGCMQRFVAETVAFDGEPWTRFETQPLVSEFYIGLSLRDGLRWISGNGYRSLFDLTRRALEARRSFATPATRRIGD